MPISRKELLVLLIGQKRNSTKTSKVLVTHPSGSGRSIRMDLNYLNIIRRQIFASLRCVTPFVSNIRKWPHPRALAGVHWKETGAGFNKPEGATFHPKTQLNDALIESWTVKLGASYTVAYLITLVA
jgi:hypothetical protein